MGTLEKLSSCLIARPCFLRASRLLLGTSMRHTPHCWPRPAGRRGGHRLLACSALPARLPWLCLPYCQHALLPAHPPVHQSPRPGRTEQPGAFKDRAALPTASWGPGPVGARARAPVPGGARFPPQVARLGGIEAILQSMRMHPANERVQEPSRLASQAAWSEARRLERGTPSGDAQSPDGGASCRQAPRCKRADSVQTYLSASGFRFSATPASANSHASGDGWSICTPHKTSRSAQACGAVHLDPSQGSEATTSDVHASLHPLYYTILYYTIISYPTLYYPILC